MTLQVCHVYATTLVAWLYWSHYVSSLLRFCRQRVSALLKTTPPAEPRAGATAPLRRLYLFARPYLWRFAAVLLLVVLSTYGKTDPAEGFLGLGSSTRLRLFVTCLFVPFFCPPNEL